MASSNSESSSSEDYWTWLPKELVCLILDKVFLVDFIRFGAVCKQWRSVFVDHKKKSKQSPMLLVPTPSDDCKLYNVFDHTIYDCRLPLPYSKRCCGSSHGWLVRAESDQYNLSITLINPFSGKTISLPPVMEVHPVYRDGEAIFMPEFHIPKVILSDDPSLNPNNYVVVTIYSTIPRVAFIRSGDQSWTYVGDEIPIHDVYFYQGQLYALDGYNKLMKINIDNTSSRSSDPRYEIVVPQCSDFCLKQYLVESSNGDLLMVRRRHWKRKRRRMHLDVTVGFEVYKLMIHPSGEEEEKAEWEEIDGLGDDALFVGDNDTIRLLASDFPNCQPNSIYYTDDCYEHNLPYEARDMGVFNFKDRSIGRHYTLDHAHKYMPPVVWIMHTFF